MIINPLTSDKNDINLDYLGISYVRIYFNKTTNKQSFKLIVDAGNSHVSKDIEFWEVAELLS